MKDFYERLGVSKTASDDEIKRAYRKLAHEHHPDKAGGDEAKFKEINEAYQVLGNKEKRAQYDRFGSSFHQQGGSPFGGAQGFRWEDVQGGFGNAGGVEFDLGDIFGDLFGFGGGGRARSHKRKGHDIEMVMDVSFYDAAFGAEHAIRFQRKSQCAHCSGSGREPGTDTTMCTTCSGKGQVEQIQRTPLGQFRSAGVCGTCHGTGQVPKQVCTVCKGSTVHDAQKELTVRIPSGVEHGQTIRITGEGEAGEHGGANGDLYITMRVAHDPMFKRDGADVLSTIPISFSQAALGAKIDVPTIDEVVSMKIPSGTQTGKVFRLKGKGAHKLDSTVRGDHLVTVIVQTPEKLSKKAKELLEELGTEL